MSLSRVALLAASAALFGTLSSCSREQGPPRDARAEAAMSAAQRLQGRWILDSFQPETPLEPVLAALLQTQLGRMVIEFNGQNSDAQGPGVTVHRTYKINEAYLDHFTATVFDQYGVGVNSVSDFSGNMLLVNSVTAPWRGRAALRRAP